MESYVSYLDAQFGPEVCYLTRGESSDVRMLLVEIPLKRGVVHLQTEIAGVVVKFAAGKGV